MDEINTLEVECQKDSLEIIPNEQDMHTLKVHTDVHSSERDFEIVHCPTKIRDSII